MAFIGSGPRPGSAASGIRTPFMGTGIDPRIQAQSAQFHQQTVEANRLKQEQLNQAERDRKADLNSTRAADVQHMLLGSNIPTKMWTDGDRLEIETLQNQPQAPQAGGFNFGGSTFPNLQAAFQQLQQQSPHIQPPAPVPAPQVPSLQGAFQQSKDIASRQGNKALEALRNLMTQRGMSDSGMSTVGEANILGNIARQAAEGDYRGREVDTGRQWEANQMNYQGLMNQQQMGYQGGIDQRGQDMNWVLNMLRTLY